MSQSLVKVLIITVVILMSMFLLKVAWDEYQAHRASEQIPIVVGIIEQIQPFPGSARVESDSEGPSANAYATVVWWSYRANAKCSDVRAHLDAEASRIAFQFHSIQNYSGNTQVFHRKGDYETRWLFHPQNGSACDYAVSVNWGDYNT
ncbi:MAG: hypothetical protein WKF92_15935 [Pyrinomonadaceae bacterium]